MLDAIVFLPFGSTCVGTFGLSDLKDFIDKQASLRHSPLPKNGVLGKTCVPFPGENQSAS